MDKDSKLALRIMGICVLVGMLAGTLITELVNLAIR
jgi:hypothetical protein